MADSSMGAPGSQPGDQDIGADDDTSQGYCIEIHVGGDGSITVGVESAADEDAEESGSDQGGEGDSDDDNAQPVKSIKEAISLVMDIYKNSGQMEGMDSGDEQFNSGYQGGSQASNSSGGM